MPGEEPKTREKRPACRRQPFGRTGRSARAGAARSGAHGFVYRLGGRKTSRAAAGRAPPGSVVTSSRARQGAAGMLARGGTARSGASAASTGLPRWWSPGFEPVSRARRRSQSPRDSSTRPVVGRKMGGAAMVRPSSLHMGTAACAGEPRTKSTDATSVEKRSLTARGLGRVLTDGGSLARSVEPADPRCDSSHPR
jgi:hypothetical protein